MSCTVCSHQPWNHGLVTYPAYRRPCAMCTRCSQPQSGCTCIEGPKPCPCPNLELEVQVSRRDAAQVLAMCAWLEQRIKAIKKKAQDEADVSFPEEKTAGVVDGTVVSYTSRVARKPELVITNDAAFTGWVAEHFPTEIVMSVRPAFLTELQTRAVETGVVLGPGGEVCESAELGEPVVYTTTRLVKDAGTVLEPLLSSLHLAALPEYIEGRSA